MKADLNVASVEEILEQIPKIDEEKVKLVVAWREQHGPFASIGEVGQIPGMPNEIVSALNEKYEIGSRQA
jgi:competence protein ComEA